ncbi:MAG: orotidine-5'-phosphate decarboxylase [Deltaproteobacteria bacterium]|nr:orotidine-5'-phosphate decarboxylase [Deltaproteobacteria bacterium]
MSLRIFQEILKNNSRQKKILCIGLDSDISKLPRGQTQLSFNQAIVEATFDQVAAFKPNSAFYEAEGLAGLEALQKTIRFIHEKAPQALVILDAKRGDIGNTSRAYAQAAFEDIGADAVTLNPYLGGEALQPFLDYKDKGCFILCRTSNLGGKEFQDLDVGGEPLYVRVARQVSGKWNKNKNCGLVMGATYPEELKKVREVVGNLPFLVPGVGEQGGDLNATLQNGSDSNGAGLLINLSRSVLFASSGHDFAQAAREKILSLLRPLQNAT